jgi:hypothetical protein
MFNREVPIRKGRWLALAGALLSVLTLTSGVIALQWIGWTLSAITCLAWGYFARVDKDTPRFIMELFYFFAALWGVYNWTGQ